MVEGLLDRSKIDLAIAAMDDASKSGRMLHRDDPSVVNADDEYSPLIGEMLLRHCKPALEEVVGKPLVPSHAYWRIYRRGGVMSRHKDRAACEVSVSVTIGSEPDIGGWPLSIRDLNGKEHSLDIPVGAGVAYQGHKIEHWRDALEAEAHRQMFLFYVIEGGEFSEHAGDAKDGNAIPPEARRSSG